MYNLEVVFLIAFIVLAAVGYKKNNRNLMLVSSLCLLVGLAGPDFMKGFMEGYYGVMNAS